MGTAVHRLSEKVALVVDDNELVRHMTARILKSAGIRSLEAHDGTHALALLTELGPAVVGLAVSDVAMRITGENLAAIIAERWPTVPVLLISGQGDPGTNCFFLPKPFQPDTLIAVVLRSHRHSQGPAEPSSECAVANAALIASAPAA
jgi:DNA-binding NtrC family response regulator